MERLVMALTPTAQSTNEKKKMKKKPPVGARRGGCAFD